MATVASLRGKKLPFEFLEKITDGFSKSRERGTGPLKTAVYEVNLEDGDIAVKRHVINAPGTRNEQAYLTSVRTIMNQKHEHVVELLAFCLEKRYDVVIRVGNRNVTKDVVVESLFCYEYFPEGSLYHNLFEKNADIDWNTRFKIIEGICAGLKFLHTLPQPVIHLNLKPQNIMLDGNMIPKIADFGYSRIIADPKQSRINTQSSVGTVGYMAPEYLYKNVNEISTRFDIYSLGLIIIEITTREINCPGINQESARAFIGKVQECIDEGLMDWHYPGLEEDHLKHQTDCIKIGLACVNLDHEKRPKVEEIVDALNATW